LILEISITQHQTTETEDGKIMQIIRTQRRTTVNIEPGKKSAVNDKKAVYDFHLVAS